MLENKKLNGQTKEKEYDLKEVPRLACLAEGIHIESERKQYDEVLAYVETYFAIMEKIKKGVSDLAVQQILDLTKYFEVEELERVMLYAVDAAQKMKRWDKAKFIFDIVDWTDEKRKPFAFMVQLVNFYGVSHRSDMFFSYAEKIMENSRMKSPFLVSLDGLLQEHPELQEDIFVWINKRNRATSKKQLSPEMEQLVEALKANIQVLINEGKAEEAKMLLEELKKYV